MKVHPTYVCVHSGHDWATCPACQLALNERESAQRKSPESDGKSHPSRPASPEQSLSEQCRRARWLFADLTDACSEMLESSSRSGLSASVRKRLGELQRAEAEALSEYFRLRTQLAEALSLSGDYERIIAQLDLVQDAALKSAS